MERDSGTHWAAAYETDKGKEVDRNTRCLPTAVTAQPDFSTV